jgi:hypothetical protein
MMCIFVFTFNLCYKYAITRINNEIVIQVIADKEFLKTLRIIVVGCDKKSILSLWTIFESGIGTAALKNLFLLQDVRFSYQDPNVLR